MRKNQPETLRFQFRALTRACIETLEDRWCPAATEFAVIGDFGNNSQSELDVANLVKSWTPDYVITVGDNDYSTDGTPDYPTNVGQYYGEFITNDLATNRFFPTLGNHDWTGPGLAQPYLNFFTLPGNERYYNFVRGPVEFFAIDSDDDSTPHEPDGITPNSIQGQWLQQALAASTAQWQVVYMHHPPFSSGSSHGSTPIMQWPYQQWGADIVLAGHDHNYERLSVNGFPYIVNGIGGASVRDMGTIIPGSIVDYSDDFGAMRVNADDASITFELITRNNQLIDTFTMNAPSPVTVAHTGGSTQVAEGGATDTYSVVLKQQPTADVTISITPGSQLNSNVPSLTFTSANWNVAQVVTLTAIDDNASEGDHTGTVTHSVTSDDPAFGGKPASSITANITDNEPAPTLIAVGATWKYLGNGSNQQTAWRAPGFDDSSWPSGPSQLGFGDGDESTVLTSGFLTYYFRKSFNVVDPAAYSTMNLRLVRDDGAVVYLNGNELFRTNMPAGTITSSTPASSTLGQPQENQFNTFAVNPSLLLPGTNVIAVEVHQSNTGSSDVSFNLDLVGTLRAGPNNPPVLNAIGAKSVNEGSLLSFTATSTDPDLPSDTRSWSLLAGAGAGGTPVPSGASINASGQFTWTPSESQDGTHIFRVRVTDAAGEFDEEEITVTVGEVNQPPVLAPIGNKSVPMNTQLSFVISATDPDVIGGVPDALTYSATGLPPGANFDPATRTFSWTPTQAGQFPATFSVSDGIAQDPESITITVTDPSSTPVNLSFQNNATYSGTIDAEIRNGNKTGNFGNINAVKADSSPLVSGLIKWDIGTIPAGSAVQSVSLTLRVTDGSPQAFELYEVLKNWTEASVTWNNFAAGSAWQTSGAQGATDRGTSVLGTLSGTATGLRTFTLNAAGIAVVQAWVNTPNSNFGLIFQDYVSATDAFAFNSSEHGTISRRPKLNITYLPPASSPAAPASLRTATQPTALTLPDPTQDAAKPRFLTRAENRGLGITWDIFCPGDGDDDKDSSLFQ